MCEPRTPPLEGRVRPCLELADVTTAEYSMWYSIWLRTREWHHQTFMAWLVTLIGAKARESNEAWEARHP